jgi:hypothetical protein
MIENVGWHANRFSPGEGIAPAARFKSSAVADTTILNSQF